MSVPPELLEYLTGHLATLMQLANPFFFNLYALSLATLIIINPVPLRTHMEKKESTLDVATIWLRRILVFTLVVLTFVMPFYMFSIFNVVNAESYKEVETVSRLWLMGLLKTHWWRILVGLIAGIVIKALYDRYVAPPLSVWWRSLRVQAVTDRLSDVRETIGTLQTKSFNPTQFYKERSVFFGLGQSNEPLYVSHNVFKKTNIQIVGPTRFGKGVLLGALLDQCLRFNHSVIYVDPKDDEWLPWILWHSAAEAKKRFVVVDLNADGKQRWHPFAGGALRDRRARIIAACGLANAGTDADFYKRAERGILDRILPNSSGSIASLLEALEARDTDGTPLKNKAPSLFEGLRELSQIPALNPAKGGMSVGDVLTKGWVWYFRGSLDDRAVLLATRLFVMEVIQEAKRLKMERESYQLTFAVDELKFLISKELSDALATSLGHNVNMIVLHQSIEDLRGPEDKTLNAEAIEKSVLINCQIKVLYKCDPETAEWGAKLSGTKMVESTRMQKMHVNSFGGEVFERERSVSLTEEGLIPENTLLTLSPMVGAFYTPHDLAKVVFTSPVPTQKGEDIFQENPVYTEWRMANLKREKEDQGPKILLEDKPAAENKNDSANATTAKPQQPQVTKSVSEKQAQPAAANPPKKEGQNNQSQVKPTQSQGDKQSQKPGGNKQQNQSKPAQSQQTGGQKPTQNKAENTNKQNQNTQKQNNQSQSQPKQEQQAKQKPQPNSDNKQAQPKPLQQDVVAKTNEQTEKNKPQEKKENNGSAQNSNAANTKNEQQKQIKQQSTQKGNQQNNTQKPKQFDLNELKNKLPADTITPDQLIDTPPPSVQSADQKTQVAPQAEKTVEPSASPNLDENTNPPITDNIPKQS